MADFKNLTLDTKQLRVELDSFKALLDGKGKGDLSERSDLLPFFDSSPNLCAFIGTYNSGICDFSNVSVAREFSIFGDHVADLAIGDQKNNQYCFVEFEDAKEKSIFKKTAKLTPDWSTRYEHGFSQLTDWILWLENNKGQTAYQTRFNAHVIRYNMLLIIGRDRDISQLALRQRFDWRNESVVVHSKKVNCMTYDQLYDDLSTRASIRGI